MFTISHLLKRLSKIKLRLITGIIVISLVYLILSIWLNSLSTNIHPQPHEILGMISDSKQNQIFVDQDITNQISTRPQIERINWNVPSDHPRKIIIPDLGVEGFVQEVGITENGAMQVPENTAQAGWFNLRATPGSNGLSIINGHKLGNSDGGNGIFANLQSLSPGQELQIQMGDMQKLNFIVTHTFTVSNNEAQQKLYEKYHSYQLNLVTCVGEYLSDEQTFDQRQIVVTKLVS